MIETAITSLRLTQGLILLGRPTFNSMVANLFLNMFTKSTNYNYFSRARAQGVKPLG